MSVAWTLPLDPDRLALLSRAALESQRFAAPDREPAVRAAGAACGRIEAPERAKWVEESRRLWPARTEARSSAAPAQAVQLGGAQDAMRQKASLELKLAAEVDKLRGAEAALRREQDDHKQAMESLALQQKRIKELQDERAQLLSNLSELESKLRLQISETEQANLKFDKLKTSRQLMGDQATEQLSQINALREENERLRQQMEAMLRERDRKVETAQAAAQEAQSETADSAFGRVWSRLRAAAPEVFLETHVANEKSFERLADVVVDMLRAFVVMEMHVHQLLKDLRQVGAEGDKLSHFYMMLTKNPGVLDTMRNFLVTGKGGGNLTNLLRAEQAWTRAFSSGMYKALAVRSPAILSELMNPRSWPIKTSFTTSEEAAVGKYYKETAYKSLPEKAASELRKHAADMAYEDYNELMKRK